MNNGEDRRYTTVKNLISGGYIKSFLEIFDILPKSVVARDLGINNVRFSKLIDHVQLFLLKDIYRFAEFIEVDGMDLLYLIHQKYMEDKKNKKQTIYDIFSGDAFSCCE